MEALGLQDTYVGSSAQALRGILAISQPLRGGTVQDWDNLEAVWQHVYTRELGVSASDLPALVTIPPLATRQEESTMAEILVEKLGVPALYLANKMIGSDVFVWGWSDDWSGSRQRPGHNLHCAGLPG